IRRCTWPETSRSPRLLPRWNGRATDRVGTSLTRSQNAACRHRSRGRRGHYAYGETGTQKDYGRSEHAWNGKTGKALLRAKRIESSGWRGLRSSARPKKARQRTLSRRKRRDRSDQGLSCLGDIHWRALCQARQNHAAMSGRKWRLRQYDSCPQFLHVERASPKRHAVDLSRFRAWVVVPVSQVIRSASFAVSRFRRYQLKAAVALVILSCIRVARRSRGRTEHIVRARHLRRERACHQRCGHRTQ